MPRHYKRFWLALAPWLVPASAALTTTTVQAYDGLGSADLAVGYVQVSELGPLPSSGGQLTVGGGYGLGDTFVARASLGYGLQVGRTRVASAGLGRLEVAYLLDVLSVVPFAGIGASAWLFRQSGLELAPAAHGLIGCDLLLSREWNVGLDMRLGLVFHGGDAHRTFESSLRLSRMFDLL